MSPEKKKPDRIVWAGGREFLLYNYFDETIGEELLNLPNFQERPEYTDEGRPFALTVQESRPMGKSDDQEDTDPGDCGSCVYFFGRNPTRSSACVLRGMKTTRISLFKQ